LKSQEQNHKVENRERGKNAIELGDRVETQLPLKESATVDCNWLVGKPIKKRVTF
jgi:hypothetical protein